MPASLLILTDFFQAADRALDYATNLAEPLGARLVLLHVRRDSVLDPEMFTGELSNLSKETIALALSRVAGNLAVPVVAEVGHGQVVYAAADALSRHQAALLVLGRPDYSETPDELVKTTSLDILRTAPHPMLVVPYGVGSAALPKRVLLAVDGEAFTLGEHAATVRHLFQALHAQLTVLHVVPAETHETTAVLDSVLQAGLAPDQAALRTRTAVGNDPAAAILAATQAAEFDMVVLIARRRSFLGQLFHRSVTAQVLLHSALPVLVLPAQ